ncbi:MAG: universal stress protein [Rhodobacteraceae bacterium]|nr:universal stress protein [Alphaproteobacteria bacterium]NNK66761.1 universal stress protein [Paracoccaceae bacterium]
MAKILVATDLTPRADRAISRAFVLAREHGADLTVLHVIDGDLPEVIAKRMRSEVGTYLARICKGNKGADTVNWSAQIEAGSPETAIASCAKDLPADLVVLGLHRPRSVLDKMRTATLEHIVRNCGQPVLLAALPAEQPYQTVLAAVDFTPASTAAIATVQHWAPKAKIHAFHAVYTGLGRVGSRDTDHAMARAILSETRTVCDAWMDRNGMLGDIDPPEIIEGALGSVYDRKQLELKPQIIALGAHARHGLAHWVLGGFARNLIRDPPCDLLITKPD